MRKALLALLTAIALVLTGAGAANAAKPVPNLTSGVVFTIEPLSGLDVNAVAREWSKTDITVIVGDCAVEDKFCIQPALVDAPCGGAVGCAYSRTGSNESCLVEVDPDYVGTKVGYSIFLHEVGHCIWHVGGRYGHTDDPASIMYAYADPNVKGKIGLSALDHLITDDLF